MSIIFFGILICKAAFIISIVAHVSNVTHEPLVLLYYLHMEQNDRW